MYTTATSKRKKLVHDRSLKLEEHENARIIDYIQSTNGITTSTAVIQLYLTSKSSDNQWIKFATGVICLVKDYSKKSYFFRMFNLIPNLLWEEELHKDLDLNKLTDNFYMINTSSVKLVGLNFSSVEEALKFHRATTRAINSLYKLEYKMKHTESNCDANNNDIAAVNYDTNNNNISMGLNSIKTSSGSTGDSSNINSRRDSIKRFFKLDFKRLSNKRQHMPIRKHTISTPKDFVHINHVGLSSNNSNFDIQVNDENDNIRLIIEILKQVHIKPNKQTVDYAKTFIENNGGYQQYAKEIKQKKFAPKAPSTPTTNPIVIVSSASMHEFSKPAINVINETPNMLRPPPKRPPPPPKLAPNTAQSEKLVPEEAENLVQRTEHLHLPQIETNISFLSPIPTSASTFDASASSISNLSTLSCFGASSFKTPPVSSSLNENVGADCSVRSEEGGSRSAFLKSIENFKGGLKPVGETTFNKSAEMSINSETSQNRLMNQLINALAEMRPFLNSGSDSSDEAVSDSFEMEDW